MRISVAYGDRHRAPEFSTLKATLQLCPEHGAIRVMECSCTRYADECDFGACDQSATTVSAQGRPVCERHRQVLAKLGQ